MVLLAAMVCGCGENGGRSSDGENALNDSIKALTEENNQLRREQDELLATLGDIEDGFREINEAQGRLTIDRRGEGANARERIKEDMQYIQETMAQNAELIEKLRARLRETGDKNQQLQRLVDNLTAQLEQKNAEVRQLRTELEAKNIRIAELDEQVGQLNEDLTTQQMQNQDQDRVINRQDRQLNAAWYCTGSKSELKSHNILKSGKVLEGDFDASYFTEIDIRQVAQINLNSKKAEILTTHPAGSYRLEKDANKVYTLYITDSQKFWSTSKYLVIQTK